MILVDKICSYFTSIVLVWITYFFLAETKSINSLKDTFFYEKNLTDQRILLYTTGSDLKYYSIDENFLINSNSKKSFKNFPDQQYKLFDYYFNEYGLLSIITFDRKEKNFLTGYLNLNLSSFEENRRIFYNYSDIHFVVDKNKNIVYIANKETNSIDYISLNNLDKNILLDCNSPDFIEFNQNSNSLSWLEKKGKSCFYEWQLDKKEKKLITCVDQLDVQGFQINSNENNLYYFSNNGNLYSINLKNNLLKNVLIYENIPKRKKYRPKAFKFQVINNYYFFSDLVYKAIFMVNFENSKVVSKILFTDVPCIYDFRILTNFKRNNTKGQNLLLQKTEDLKIEKTSTENLKQVNKSNLEFCTIITCNYIINLILISFILLVLVILPLFVFLSKKRFCSLLEDQQDLPKNFFLKKISLIRMNMKKMMQQL